MKVLFREQKRTHIFARGLVALRSCLRHRSYSLVQQRFLGSSIQRINRRKLATLAACEPCASTGFYPILFRPSTSPWAFCACYEHRISAKTTHPDHYRASWQFCKKPLQKFGFSTFTILGPFLAAEPKITVMCRLLGTHA
jgi:hypothetical protein